MPRIEELPDDFDEKLNMNSTSTSTSQPQPSPQPPSQSQPSSSPDLASMLSSSSLPFPSKYSAPTSTASSSTPSAAMPPAMENTKSYSTSELLAELNRTPLFMTSLDSEENPDLEALRALAYEGTKTEVAENFRQQGNECARLKDWRNAREYYDKALGVLRHGVTGPEMAGDGSGRLDGGEGPAEVDWLEKGKGKGKDDRGGGDEGEVDGTVGEEEVDVEAEARKEKEIEEACYVNRALCNLELQNYGSCTRDCASALLLNPHNIKALYRTSLATYALQKLTLSHDACTLLLTLDPGNTAAQALLKRINTSITLAANAKREREEREARERARKTTLAKALKDRGWHVKMTGEAPVDAQDAEIKLEDADDGASEISVPVLLLYPTSAQSELVKGIRENETVAEHLEYILPDAPWDVEREYQRLEEVECYMETKEGGLIKVGRKVSLGKVLSSGKVEVRDGLCRVFVVPKGKVKGWVEEFKRRSGR